MGITETLTQIDDSKVVAGSSSNPPNVLSRANTSGQDDLELMSMPSVVGRESGERDPLLLRGSIMSDETIKGLKQSVLLHVSDRLS
jgi:hypothetical protein